MVRVFSSTGREVARVPAPASAPGVPQRVGFSYSSLSLGRPGQQGPGGRGSGLRSLATVAAAPPLVPSCPVHFLRAWGSPRCRLSGSGQSKLPGSQKADGQCQGSARARLGSAAGPGSSPASAPHSAPLPLPRPPGRRRHRLPAPVKEERAARSRGSCRRGALRLESRAAVLRLLGGARRPRLPSIRHLASHLAPRSSPPTQGID